MAYLGHPIVGDDRYGDRALNRAHPGLTRLWCKSLCFTGECAMQKYAGVRFESAAPGWNME